MSKRITTSGSMTPGRIRKSPPVSSNTQRAFEYDMDDFEADENEFDGNYPIIRDVPFYSQQQGQSSIQISNHNKNTGFYYTPQTKRKRVQDQVADSPDSFKEQLDLLQNILKDVNRKVDILNTKEDAFQKKLDHVHQHLGSLIRKGNKNPTPNEPPVELPIIEYNKKNLLAEPIGLTPGCLMKRLVNQLFNKEEIMEGKHEADNERTQKIKDAVQAYFFQGGEEKLTGFWDNEGKITRGNQRRGHVHRNKPFPEKQIKTTSRTTTDDNAGEESVADAGII